MPKLRFRFVNSGEIIGESIRGDFLTTELNIKIRSTSRISKMQCVCFALKRISYVIFNFFFLQSKSEGPLIDEETGEVITKPPLTGIPQIDYVWDPNLPRELNGYD